MAKNDGIESLYGIAGIWNVRRGNVFVKTRVTRKVKKADRQEELAGEDKSTAEYRKEHKSVDIKV